MRFPEVEGAIATFTADSAVLFSVVASDGTIVAEEAAARVHFLKLRGWGIRD
jgi:hypothetical protein